MINGATGAFAAIISTFIPKPEVAGKSGEGVELLFPSVMVAGVFMGCVWLIRGERFITLVPEAVMVGFRNGLAVVIGLAQLHPFHDKAGMELVAMLVIAVVALVTMEFVPRLPYRAARAVPSSLLAILASVAVEQALRASGYRTDTIGDVAQFTDASIYPVPFLADDKYDLSMLSVTGAWQTVAWNGVLLCLVGVIESLMTTEVVTDLVKTPGDPAAVIWSMGAANVVSGFFGGMGGNAMIGLSTINGLNGGRGRIAPIVTALCVMATVMGAYPALNLIPIAALVGIMIVVVLHTFSWESVPYVVSALLPGRSWRAAVRCGSFTPLPEDVDRYDAFIMLAVTVSTFKTNLVYAVCGGIILAALRFSWATSQHLAVYGSLRPDGSKVYAAHGELFFASAMRFHLWFKPDDDPINVELNLENEPDDHSAIVALEKLKALYAKRGKTLTVNFPGVTEAPPHVIASPRFGPVVAGFNEKGFIAPPAAAR
mmetsp:Transcript_3847/g.11382  ORF Transcript_3847/g.11382 Transcript_3847/m.11382 type:complete len:485 (-) Transcript_3847:132-1586(-)